ncbi:hypothetical protein NEF87_000323 [Candidatus Lokiarchaeum ossiferum]|uniref:Nitroreductase domain-containing protein n=1 Tax=Candidatus Lokiarchaeum ossiferum TaxID=2951803 RepID=A0ABY6HKK5_9ARCH|nr:hypothetical protein NEF87_000323 [Candidatus Lokiarchaeum sp. B-35]
MDVNVALEKRRAYRSLTNVEISDEIVEKLGKAAQLMPSCFNKQPWRFVFVKDDPNLNRLKEEALNEGNRWAKESSMIIAVFTKKDLDCVIKDREYYMFDTGMAVSAILLRATELDLVAHPIAGYSPEKVKEILEIPDEYTVITLLIIGKKNAEIPDYFDDWKRKAESTRPERLKLKEFVFTNKFRS